MRTFPGSVALLLVGCAIDPSSAARPVSDGAAPLATPPASGPDADGDHLSDEDERSRGTDVDRPDTDGDGHLDGSEVWHHTDPLDPDDHPYAGGWRMGACRHDIVPTGPNIGDVAENFELVDQFGEALRLHDFCDRQVLLVSSALWCSACQRAAPIVDDWVDQFGPDGFIAITLLGEDVDGRPAGPDDVARWVDAFDLTHPVVADPGWAVTLRFTGPGTVGLPSMHQLGPGAEILRVDDAIGVDGVRAALP